MDKMRFIAANLTVIVWAFVFGMIVGYIGSALAGTPLAGIVAAVIAVIAVNGVHANS
ncbi:MAG: Hypothetical protein AJITA_00432 [Acetilactobacillus jinshanensis]